MKSFLMAGLIFSVLFFSCQDDDEEAVFQLIEGTYTGTFQRTSPTIRSVTSAVSLTLEGGQFSGSSDTRHYPAIGEGTYEFFHTDSIRFTNGTAWTADFDWSLILSGSYQISQESEELIIARDYGGGTYDVYTLIREE